MAKELVAPSSPSGLRLPDRAALSPAMGVEMTLLRRMSMRRMRKAGAATHTDTTPNPAAVSKPHAEAAPRACSASVPDL